MLPVAEMRTEKVRTPDETRVRPSWDQKARVLIPLSHFAEERRDRLVSSAGEGDGGVALRGEGGLLGGR